MQQGIRTSEPGYSLKDLEVFYGETRGEGVATAADSVVAYERYRKSGDTDILEEIRAYNETDCRSTRGLRDWLVRQRPDGMPWRPKPQAQEAAAETPGVDRLEVERTRLRELLRPARARLGEGPTDLLFELAFFHQREDKRPGGRSSTGWRARARSVGRSRVSCRPWPRATEAVKRSRAQRYRFPAGDQAARGAMYRSGRRNGAR